MQGRFWVAVALLALVGLGLFNFVTLRNAPPPAEEVETVAVERGTLVATVSAAGRVVAAEDRTLSFAISGQVAEIVVEEGDSVEVGSLLARLDTEDVKFERRQAAATLAQAQAGLAQLLEGPSPDEIAVAEAELELARINLQQAQSAWDTVKWRSNASMLPQGVALQQATIEYQQALANYNLTIEGPSPEEIAQAEAEVERAQAAFEQTRLPFERSPLTAPFSGTVAEVFIAEGDTISPGSVAIRLLDLSRFLIELDVDEVDIGQIRVGQKAVVTLDALPQVEYSGKVDFIALAASTESGVVTYAVRILLADHDPRLRVEMTANVEIETQRVEGALLVPNRIVQVDRETGRFYVEKVTPQGSIIVEITPGLRNDTFTQILDGLSEGDQVIVRPLSSQELGTLFFGGEE